MRESYPKRRRLLLLLISFVACIGLSAPAETQPPAVKVIVDKTPGGGGGGVGACDGSVGDNCKLFVQDRGKGACRSPRSNSGIATPGNPSGTFCDQTVVFELKVLGGPLDSDHLVMIQWNPSGSSPDSHLCMDQVAYVFTANTPVFNGGSATATATNAPECASKKILWLYDVVLFKAGAEIARDDPGVLIEN